MGGQKSTNDKTSLFSSAFSSNSSNFFNVLFTLSTSNGGLHSQLRVKRLLFGEKNSQENQSICQCREMLRKNYLSGDSMVMQNIHLQHLVYLVVYQILHLAMPLVTHLSVKNECMHRKTNNLCRCRCM